MKIKETGVTEVNVKGKLHDVEFCDLVVKGTNVGEKLFELEARIDELTAQIQVLKK